MKKFFIILFFLISDKAFCNRFIAKNDLKIYTKILEIIENKAQQEEQITISFQLNSLANNDTIADFNNILEGFTISNTTKNVIQITAKRQIFIEKFKALETEIAHILRYTEDVFYFNPRDFQID